MAARPAADTQPAAQLHAAGAGYRDPTDVITGIFTVGSRTALCLFDTGASTSFIATSFVVESGLSTVTCGRSIDVETPICRTTVDRLVAEVFVSIGGHDFVLRPYVMDMRSFDAILGMDWLTTYQAHVDCIQRTVSLVHPSCTPVLFQGSRLDAPVPVVTALQAVRLL